MKIGLISCTKKKRSQPCKAYELYDASQLFRKAWAYCRDNYDQNYILSAKYGLLHPEADVEPYEVTLNKMKKPDRMRWGVRVYKQLAPLISDDDVIYFHAGTKYREGLLPLLTSNECVVPLEGLGIGYQLGWYSQFTNKGEDDG